MAATTQELRSLGGTIVGRGRPLRDRPPIVVWVVALGVGAAMALPLVYLVLRTLGAGPEVWELLFRTRTAEIILRSLLLVVTVTGACMALAVPLAWLTVRTDLPLRRFWAVATALPLVIPSYIGGFLVIVALGPRGMLQQALAPLGVERLPEVYGFPGAVLTLTLLSYPYVLLTVRASLWRLDPALEESARSLGRGPWETFLRVTLPLLRPAIAAGSLLVALYTLSDFGAVSMLRYETFTWAIYVQYESAFNRMIAAALSLVLVAFTLLLLFLEARTRSRAAYYRSAAGATTPPPQINLGRWKAPALFFCTLIVLFALILPMTVLLYWVGRGLSAGEPLLLLWGPGLNSITAAAWAAGATVAAALPVAFLSVRCPGRLSAAIERLSYVGFALPGIAVALALVFFGAHFARPLYQTMPLLVFAYGVLFFPAALGAVRSSLHQVSPHLEEVARSLGHSRWGVLRTVSLPLMRSGLLAGAALVFLLTMKELPATLILSPLGFKTLATAIWSAASEAFFAQAAAPALLLILISSVPLAFLARDERRGIR